MSHVSVKHKQVQTTEKRTDPSQAEKSMRSIFTYIHVCALSSEVCTLKWNPTCTLHISNENGRYIGSIRPSVTPHPHQPIYPSFSSSRTHWLPQTTKQLIRNVIINDWLIVIYRSSITCGEPQLHHRQRCLYQTPMKQPPPQQSIPIDAVWESNPYPALVQYITRSE